MIIQGATSGQLNKYLLPSALSGEAPPGTAAVKMGPYKDAPGFVINGPAAQDRVSQCCPHMRIA